jgi:hypothetical protein
MNSFLNYITLILHRTLLGISESKLLVEQIKPKDKHSYNKDSILFSLENIKERTLFRRTRYNSMAVSENFYSYPPKHT